MTDFAVIESPRRIDPEIGTTIDNYLITEKLGEGTFGRVYKVVHAEGGVFALKLLKLWEVAYPKDREIIIRRFQREFELTRIDSPYLVRGQDYGKIEGNPYIVMDYCNGGSLADYCGRVNALRNVDQIGIDVLRGLSELHQRGFFHRDIKPQNILLESEGNARVTDFGIAGNKTSTLTVRNIFGNVEQIFGTWAYIAPEQANNKVAFKALDAVADIFSFGVTMFELFTGQYPFPPYRIEDEQQLAEYLANARTGNFQGLIMHQQRIPDNWLIIIRRCLEPDYAQKRWQNVKDILERLGYEPGKTAATQYRWDKDDLCLQITYGEEMNQVYNLTRLQHPQGQHLQGRDEAAPSSRVRNILTAGRKDPGVNNLIEIREDVTAYISRRHATFEVWPEHKTWVVRDGQWVAAEHKWVRSMNGVYLNGKAVGMEGEAIKPDDILTIGDTVLKVTTERR